MKMTSTCVAAALFTWMSSGAAWAACSTYDCNTPPPPATDGRIAGCTDGDCHTDTLPLEGTVLACGDGDCHTDTPPLEGTVLACGNGNGGGCNTDTSPEAVIACDGMCDNTETPPQTDGRIACEEARCNTDTPPEAVIACGDTCNNTDTQPQTDAKPA